MSRHESASIGRLQSGTHMGWRVAALLVLACGGCSSLSENILAPTKPDSGGRSEQRKEAMIREFDARRNAVQVEAAEAALERGDYQESEHTLRAVLGRDESHQAARLLLAEVLLLTGRRPEAFTQVEHALREYPSDPRVHHAMAVLLDASGRPDEARAHYERSAELSPEFQRYASAHEAAIAADGGPAGQDENAERRRGERMPAMPPAVDHAVPAVWDAAAPTASTGAAVKDGMPSPFGPEADARLQAGGAALAEGDLEAAKAEFEAAVAADPQNRHIPVHAAVAALEQNHPQLAVALLRPATERFPEAAAVHRTLGTAYYRLGDYASAQVAVRQALSLDNSNALSYLLMGCTLEKLGQPSAAVIHFERAAALRPKARNPQR